MYGSPMERLGYIYSYKKVVSRLEAISHRYERNKNGRQEHPGHVCVLAGLPSPPVPGSLETPRQSRMQVWVLKF